MATTLESFEQNDMRKSARIPLRASAGLLGIQINVSNVSLEGFRITDTSGVGRVEVNATVEVIFTLYDPKFNFDFTHKARAVWHTETQAGFVWIRLPDRVRSMLRQYLVQHSTTRFEPLTLATSPSVTRLPTIDLEVQTESAVQPHKKRTSRLAGYAIASVILLLGITALGYENQFVFSTRAFYPGNLTEVVATADGMIESVVVNVGDLVNAGDIIATLNTRDLDSQISAMELLVKERKKAVEVTRSAVTETSTPLSMYVEVARQQLAVAQAKAAEALATKNASESDYERMLELDSSGLISKSALDHARADAEVASSHHRAGVAEVLLTKRVVEEAMTGRFFNGNKVNNDLQQIRISLAQRQGDFAQAEFELSRFQALKRNSSIYAMTSGHIFSIERPAGKYIKSGESLAVLSGDGLPIMAAKFDPKDAERLQPGAMATVFLNGGSQSVPAHISQIGHTRISHLHPFTSLIELPPGEITVELELESIPKMLIPGMPVDVKVNIGRLSSMLRSATSASEQ